MNEEGTWERLEKCCAYRKGHFVLTSRFHSDRFVEKVFATADWHTRAFFAWRIDDWAFRNDRIAPQVVVGAPMGAIALATEVSSVMQKPVAFLEKKARIEDGELVEALTIRGANAQIVTGQDILLVEDVITKGTNTTKALQVLAEAGANVVALACIVNRESYRPPEGIEFFTFATTPPEGPIKSWPPEECPLCREGVPVNTDSGHGEDFLREIKEKNPALWERLSG